MKMGITVTLLGILFALVMAFENLGMYLIGAGDWLVFILVMAIAAGIGALPGLLILLVTRNTAGSKKSPIE
jgi:hypothetical protein